MKTLAEIHAPYGAALKTLHDELQPQLAEANRAVERLEQAAAALAQEPRDPLALEALALLAGEGVVPPRTDAASVREKLRVAQHQRDVLKRAVAFQGRTVEDERRAASIAFSEVYVADYRKRVARVAGAVIALGQAVQAEAEFRAAVVGAGADFCFPLAIGHSVAGSPEEAYGRIAGYLRHCAQHGYIARKDIPGDWLERWGFILDAAIADEKGLREKQGREAVAVAARTAAANKPRGYTPAV